MYVFMFIITNHDGRLSLVLLLYSVNYYVGTYCEEGKYLAWEQRDQNGSLVINICMIHRHQQTLEAILRSI